MIRSLVRFGQGASFWQFKHLETAKLKQESFQGTLTFFGFEEYGIFVAPLTTLLSELHSWPEPYSEHGPSEHKDV
jgi:hypothetical protein